ncbi:SPFH domain-containing protein [Helicobacter trogontum]|uniref:Prohibitin family protein n=1 Tax=Helicobacter trogontum TaxID=50960 RepID=A0A4U8S9E8_9HELI|nr:SPFH domain-containing protein [Helicobacter trogontum]TLD82600.1 prohibitin family protein [Helicobacter trogontum]
MPIDLNEHRRKQQSNAPKQTPQNNDNRNSGNSNNGRNNRGGFGVDSMPMPSMPSGKFLILIILAVILVINFVVARPFVIINSGEVGIKVNLGKYDDVPLTPGLHFFIPIIQQVIVVDTRMRVLHFSRNEDMGSVGRDDQSVLRNDAISVMDSRGLPVSIELTVQYRLDPSKVPETIKNYRLSWEQKIINPVIRDVVRSVVGNYPAEDLPNKRDEIAGLITSSFEAKLRSTPNQPVIFDSIQLREIVLPPMVKERIEQVQAAKQEADRAKQEANALRERAQGRADAAIIEAKGQAQANKLLSESLSQRLLELRQIDVQGKFNEALKENKDAQIFLTPGGSVPNIWVDSKSKQRTTISNNH